MVTGLELILVCNISKNKTKASVDDFDTIWAKLVEMDHGVTITPGKKAEKEIMDKKRKNGTGRSSRIIEA